MNSVEALDFKASSGGRFLYSSSTQAFALTIVSSNYTCSGSSYS